MVPYGVLALALAVTAKVLEKDVRDGKWFKLRPWLMLLSHVPILLALLPAYIYLAVQLTVAKVPWDMFEHVHMVIHALALAFVGLVLIVTAEQCGKSAHWVRWAGIGNAVAVEDEASAPWRVPKIRRTFDTTRVV